MAKLSAEDYELIARSRILENCGYPKQTMEVLERAWSDPDFVRGWTCRGATAKLEAPSINLWGNSPLGLPLFEAIRFIDLALVSAVSFEAVPKLSPTVRRKTFEGMRRDIQSLLATIHALPPPLLDYYDFREEQVQLVDALLGHLDGIAEDELLDPGNSRPNARFADRVDVTKSLIQRSRELGFPSYSTLASLINVTFSDYEAIDAVYVQSVARKLPERN